MKTEGIRDVEAVYGKVPRFEGSDVEERLARIESIVDKMSALLAIEDDKRKMHVTEQIRSDWVEGSSFVSEADTALAKADGLMTWACREFEADLPTLAVLAEGLSGECRKAVDRATLAMSRIKQQLVFMGNVLVGDEKVTDEDELVGRIAADTGRVLDALRERAVLGLFVAEKYAHRLAADLHWMAWTARELAELRTCLTVPAIDGDSPHAEGRVADILFDAWRKAAGNLFCGGRDLSTRYGAAKTFSTCDEEDRIIGLGERLDHLEGRHLTDPDEWAKARSENEDEARKVRKFLNKEAADLARKVLDNARPPFLTPAEDADFGDHLRRNLFARDPNNFFGAGVALRSVDDKWEARCVAACVNPPGPDEVIQYVRNGPCAAIRSLLDGLTDYYKDNWNKE